jgi:lysophospholipase L1-like esterase
VTQAHQSVLKKRRKKDLFYIYGISLVILVLFGSYFTLLTKNSIQNNGNWEATKTTLKMYVLGSDAFFNGRQALSHNRLNLGAWHGFQEVISRKAFPIKEASFSFYLEKDAYLYILFNRAGKEDNYSALRLSSDPRFSNSIFQVSNKGKFLERTPVPIPMVEVGQWHQCKISFLKDALHLSLNKKSMGTFSIPLKGSQMIGFRGGYRNTCVDDIILRDNENLVLLKESFSNKKNLLTIIIKILILALFIHSVFALFATKKKIESQNLFFSLILFNLVTASILLIASFYYSSFYTDTYPHEKHHRKREERWIAAQTKRRIEDTQKQIAKEHDLPSYRIMFIGSSQTWGAGAAHHYETFVHRIDRRLNGLLKGRYHATCINISISGQDSAGLYKIYEKFIQYDPELVILNLSNNDQDAKVLEDSLNSFLRLNEEKDIDTLFILEANSIETHPSGLLMHPVMMKVAKQNRIMTIDMHHYLKKHYDDGLLWWDNVHLTSFGHELAAKRICQEIRVFLSEFLKKEDV